MSGGVDLGRRIKVPVHSFTAVHIWLASFKAFFVDALMIDANHQRSRIQISQTVSPLLVKLHRVVLVLTVPTTYIQQPKLKTDKHGHNRVHRRTTYLERERERERERAAETYFSTHVKHQLTQLLREHQSIVQEL
jgi:hypothetical protein